MLVCMFVESSIRRPRMIGLLNYLKLKIQRKLSVVITAIVSMARFVMAGRLSIVMAGRCRFDLFSIVCFLAVSWPVKMKTKTTTVVEIVIVSMAYFCHLPVLTTISWETGKSCAVSDGICVSDGCIDCVDCIDCDKDEDTGKS